MLVLCRPYTGSSANDRAPEALEASIRSCRNFSGDLQFESRMARSKLSRVDVEYPVLWIADAKADIEKAMRVTLTNLAICCR
jgi:hypothetical protein